MRWLRGSAQRNWCPGTCSQEPTTTSTTSHCVSLSCGGSGWWCATASCCPSGLIHTHPHSHAHTHVHSHVHSHTHSSLEVSLVLLVLKWAHWYFVFGSALHLVHICRGYKLLQQRLDGPLHCPFLNPNCQLKTHLFTLAFGLCLVLALLCKILLFIYVIILKCFIGYYCLLFLSSFALYFIILKCFTCLIAYCSSFVQHFGPLLVC